MAAWQTASDMADLRASLALSLATGQVLARIGGQYRTLSLARSVHSSGGSAERMHQGSQVRTVSGAV